MTAPGESARPRWRQLLHLGLFLVAGLLATEGASPAATADIEGRPIERIELRGDVPMLPLARLRQLLVLQPGAPFRLSGVAKSLRNLHASGLVSEVEAYAEPSPAGVVVTFALWGRIQVESVRLEGDLGLKAKDLRSVLELRHAEPLIDSRVIRGVWDLEDRLHGDGFLAASVRSLPRVDEENKSADVVYRIESGPRFTIEGVSFAGAIEPLRPDQLLERLRQTSGKPYRERAVRADAERLEDWLLSQAYRLARVDEPSAAIDWEAGIVDLVHNLEVGPRFHVEIDGAEMSKLRKRGLLPFLDAQRYDEAVLMQSVSKIRRHYQELGHYEVRVESSETRVEELIHLSITIEPGPVFELAEIDFDGNQAVSDRQLAELMSTAARRLLAVGSGRLVEEALNDDLANIRSFYRLQGYWDAEIGPFEVSKMDRRRLALRVPIHEGSQRRVVELSLTGADQVSQSELLRRLPLRAGSPFHPILLEQSVGAIRAYYESQAFESVQISTALEWHSEQTLVDVRFRVLEGPRSVVDRIVVRGNQRTDDRVIRRTMKLKPGDAFNTSRLLESQRALYSLGAFSGVRVKRAPGTPFKGERDILVEVEEGARHNLTYGVGWNSEDGLSGLLGYTRNNLLGRGLTSRLDLRASERDSLARVLIHQPYLGRYRLPTTGSLFYIESTEESFTSRRRGGQLEVERIGQYSQLGLLFDYRLVEVVDADAALQELEIDRSLQEVEIASLTPRWRIDRRDDPVDPTRGWSSTLQLEYAFPMLSATEEFLKSFGQYTRHFGLGRLGSIGGSLRLGAIEPIDETTPDPTVPGDQPSQFIPISERFFAGGRSTHRAYRRDRLGIPNESLKINEEVADPTDESFLVPIGGNGLLLLNLDYRFPIAGPVEGALFLDTGNIWGDWRSIDPSEAKTGVGLGFRYRSPVGPVRLEIGWKLDRLPSEDPFVVFLSLGNPY